MRRSVVALRRSPLKVVGALVLVLVPALLLSSCGDNSRSADSNTLVVYAAGPRSLAEAVTTTFAEQTGARVELFNATTGQIMARLEAERYRPRADVVMFASQVAAEALKQDERLLRYPDPAWLAQTHPQWHDPDHYYFATSAALVGIAFRQDSAVPDVNWKTLLSGELPLRVTMPSPSRSGSAGDFVVAYILNHEQEGFGHFMAARRAGMDFAAANSQAISTLVVGAFQAMAGAVDYLIYNQIASGAPLVMHFPPDGSALVQRPIAILADTPVPDLARDFIDFYFTTDMQQQVANAYLLPARTDVPVHELRGDGSLPAVFEVDLAQALARQNRILRRFQIEVERAEVLR